MLYDYQMDNYAVIGNPIAHSLSPRIHGLFAAQTGQAINYRTLFSPLGEFNATVESFRQAGGRGLNVTLPFKEQAWEYVDDRSARADRVRAVNTIRFDGSGRVFGDSTDGTGLIRDLAGNGVEIRLRRVLLVGAGGAVRSVLGSLIDEQPAAMTVINRTRSRAHQLLELFPEARGMLHAQGFDEPAGGPYDLVINGTSAGLAGQSLPLADGILAPGACCYDMAYGTAAQVFLDWAATNGAALCCDGLGMLVEQAAEAFYLWRGMRPQTRPVIDALR